jgi:CelD/BcsL family acetyltransferase involved in cellulose biosynthesis
MIRCELVRRPPDLDAWREDWERLFAAGACEPSVSFEWSSALLRSHVQGNEEAFLLVFRDASAIRSIVPMTFRRERVGPLRLRIVSPLWDHYTTHGDILGNGADPELIAAFFDALRALPWRWDILRVRRLLEGAPLTRGLENHLEGARIRHRIRREQPSFHLTLNRDYGQYLGARSGKFRNHLKRRSRQLAGAGDMRVLRAGRDIAVDTACADMLAVEARSWKHAHGTAISAVPHQGVFYRALCEGAARRERLHLHLLYLDGRPIAHDLGIVSQGRYSYLKSSFDEDFRQYSPATVLRARLIESLIADGIASFDFPGELYEWEHQWTDELRWHKSVTVFGATPAALACALAMQAQDRLRGRDRAAQPEFLNPRGLRPRSLSTRDGG